jgi:putative MATE family efflux protein
VLAFISMILRGAGDTRTPFYFLALNVALDIVLNPLFIFGWGPVPRMGIAGAATATLFAQTISVVLAIVWLYRSRHPLRIQRGEGRYLRIDRAVLGALVGKGLPMGLQMVVMSLSMIAMIALVNSFGSHTTAAYGACFQLWNYIQMPAFAVGMAVSSMCAQNVGAGRWDRVGRIALIGVGYNLLMTGVMVCLVYVFDRPALGLFLPADGVAIGIAQHINAIAVWSFVFFGVSLVLGGVMRSTGAVIPPLVILFLALWVVRIPFAYALVGRLQADAIWWSFPVGSLTSMLLSIVYYRYGDWRSARMLAPQPSPQAMAHATMASGAAAIDAQAATLPATTDR